MKARSKASVIFKSRSPADTLLLASSLASLLKGGEVISLKGMIGAGKTFFVKGLALAMGSKTSPVSASFNLMRTYKAAPRTSAAAEKVRGKLVPHFGKALPGKSAGLNIYHFDLFRVSPEEMVNIGLEEYLGVKNGVTAIEWARSAEYLYGRGDFLELDFELAGGDSRDIAASARGGLAEGTLEKLEKKWLKKKKP